MELYLIIGYQDMEFTGNDGNPVRGRKYFFTYEADNIKGKGSGTMFISEQLKNKLTFVPDIGDECVVYYNRYGKVFNITEVNL